MPHLLAAPNSGVRHADRPTSMAIPSKPQTPLFAPQQGKGCSNQDPKGLLCLPPQKGLTCSIETTGQTSFVKLQVPPAVLLHHQPAVS